MPSGLFLSLPDMWTIAGIGALGTLIATLFSKSQENTHLILKNEHQLAIYQNTGLKLTTEDASLTSHPKASVSAKMPITHLISCVKAFDVIPLLRKLKPDLHDKAIIILIHNGLGILEHLEKEWPSLRIISGVCTHGAYLESPFAVRAFLNGNLRLGPTLGAFSPGEVTKIIQSFHEAQLPIQWEENIMPHLFEKFALNCSINLLTVLNQCKNGGLLQHLEHLKRLTNEIEAVLPNLPTGGSLFEKVKDLLGQVGENYSSMHQDVQNMRPTELVYLNEHLAHLARERKCQTPWNDHLIQQFKRIYDLF